MIESHRKHPDHKEDKEETSEEIEQQPKLEEQLKELKDQLLRALAETENVRKRADRERHEITQYAITNFARDLLIVADNLSRAIESMEKNSHEDMMTLLEGVKITEKELQKVLEKHKIQKIDPENEPFNHHFHQAMFEVETDDQPTGTVVEVLQVGYKLGDRLLRPAMVGVAKPKSHSSDKESSHT